MNYKEEMKRQYEILDQYDFERYLEIYDDLDSLMFNFEYECNIDNLPPEFQNCVFNFISTEEFADYLADRYPQYELYEVTQYKIKKRYS